ncbi:MAG: type II toxin-antitoxin system prevent-host-death family antitoxin [Candidatus Cybelea sp.]
MRVNIHEAKTQLSRLVEAAAAGQEIVIVKAGKPMAKLSALRREHGPRRLGILKGKLRVLKNFDVPLPRALLDDFEK